MAELSDNIAKLRQAYRLWHETKGGSVQFWLDLMADDVAMQSLTNNDADNMTHAKPIHSKAEAIEYFAGLASDWEMIYFKANEFIAQGDRVVMLGSCAFRFKHTGKSVETPKADIFRFRNGLIAEFYEFFDTAATIAAAQAS